MNARPMRRFLFALASHLRMTVGELEQRMDSHELAEWICYARFWKPLDDPWQQTGVLASAMLAPYSQRGHAPKPDDFIPVEKPPQHKTQIHEALARLKADLEQRRCQPPSA
jgi:hypothetical protein